MSISNRKQQHINLNKCLASPLLVFLLRVNRATQLKPIQLHQRYSVLWTGPSRGNQTSPVAASIFCFFLVLVFFSRWFMYEAPQDYVRWCPKCLLWTISVLEAHGKKRSILHAGDFLRGVLPAKPGKYSRDQASLQMKLAFRVMRTGWCLAFLTSIVLTESY